VEVADRHSLAVAVAAKPTLAVSHRRPRTDVQVSIVAQEGEGVDTGVRRGRGRCSRVLLTV